MDLPTDRIPESALAAPEVPPAVVALAEPGAFDRHREINTRRSQLENPELLRRIRAL
ncbi:hypothetical protein ACO2Q0_21345 [Phenylobacterium sp. VNQ135]|uniref:hypothetical protein n=1 Tax=Phenylobacterium sp. VNQ135 TaxID=3400922 RepID=UPI003C00633D